MNIPDKIALLCINDSGEKTASFLCQQDGKLHIFRKKSSQSCGELVGQLFHEYDALVFFCATGIAVRLIAPFIENKHTDPGVVVVDNGCRHVISLLSGHEGGANNLAYYIAGQLSAEPVITTATEAKKSFVLGIGAIAGIDKSIVKNIVTAVLARARISCREIRTAATIPGKYREKGLREGLESLSINLIKIEESRIMTFAPAFKKTAASKYLSIPAVAEPCALLAAREGKLVMPVQKINGLTLAVAKERITPV